MIDPTVVLISLIVGIGSGLLVRFTTKSKYEITFEKNAKTAYNNLFAVVFTVDAHKQQLYEIWEPHESYRNLEAAKSLDPFTYKEIQYHRDSILDQIKKIMFYKNSPYVLLSEYLLLLQYCWSAYTCLYKDEGIDNGMGMDEKTLEYHRFYAKEIITTFNNFVPESFANKWGPEFEKLGGPAYIIKPSLEPGDGVAPHHNIKNEIMDFDPRYSSIIELLLEIKNKKLYEPSLK